MKKILSILLCAAMLLGFTAIAANAAETKDIPSRSSYKEEFISALINSEDEWLDDSLKQSGILQFIDFNFDGKLEFIVKKTGSSADNYTKLYYLDGSSVKCAEINSGWMSDKYEAYYDKNNKEYRMLGAYSFHTNGDPYYYETQNVEIKFNGNTVESEFYSGLRYNGVNYGEDEKNFVYYNEQKKEVTKDEYYSINGGQLKNCVNANMLYDSAECVDYCTYPQMKKDTLSKLYDSFYYCKYDAFDSDTDLSTDKPTVKDYTATDLVNKSLSEIVEIMGGEYEIKGEYGQVYIENDIIPGMRFFTSLTIKEDTHYGYPTSSEEKEIRNAINNGKASLAYIAIYGDAKFDKNITANMTYNELTKYIGRSDCCYVDNRLYPGYDLYDDGGKQVAFFAFPQNTFGFDEEAMKNTNPKLSSIAVFPGYDSSMLYTDTDSQSDTDSASSANNSSKTSSTKTTSTGGTTNNTNGKPSGGVVSTGVATGISLAVALMAVSFIIVLIAKKRKKS